MGERKGVPFLSRTLLWRWNGDSHALIPRTPVKYHRNNEISKTSANQCNLYFITVASWLLGAGHDWATSLSLFTFMHWRRKWQPTPVFLPGESQGQGSLVGCRLWGRTESDTTEATSSSSMTDSVLATKKPTRAHGYLDYMLNCWMLLWQSNSSSSGRCPLEQSLELAFCF